MSSDECGAAAADGGERRDPSEKQEPHTVMWGINNGIDWKDHNSCSFWAENFGRSLEGQGGATRGSKVFITIIQMEAGHLRENPQTPQQQERLQAITYKAAKGWCAFF